MQEFARPRPLSLVVALVAALSIAPRPAHAYSLLVVDPDGATTGCGDNLLDGWSGWTQIDHVGSSTFLSTSIAALSVYDTIDIRCTDTFVNTMAGAQHVLDAVQAGIGLHVQRFNVGMDDVPWLPGTIASANVDGCTDNVAIPGTAASHPIVTLPAPDLTAADFGPVGCGVHGSFVSAGADYASILVSNDSGNPVIVASDSFGPGHILVRGHHFHDFGSSGAIRFIESAAGWLVTDSSVCGDGIVEGSEQCDDGGLAGEDGCAAGCTVEVGWNCSGEPSSCTPDCGDALIVGTEECDEGSANGDPDSCCDATCALRASGEVCRGAADVCDAVEACDGASPVCPGDLDLPDGDADTVCDVADNCPATANSGQDNADGDGLGDACDACPLDPANDADADTVCGDVDNCPVDANTGQENTDGDASGDACDTCTDTDADGFGNPGFAANTCDEDNCPSIANPAQADLDGDGDGDLCDASDATGLSLRRVVVRDVPAASRDAWTAQGDLATTASPNFLDDVVAGGLTVTLALDDGTPVDVIPFAGGDCVRRGVNLNSLRCRDADGSQVKLSKRPSASFFRIGVAAKKRSLVLPSVGDSPLHMTVTIPVSIDRVDGIGGCVALPGVLKCKDIP